MKKCSIPTVEIKNNKYKETPKISNFVLVIDLGETYTRIIEWEGKEK